MTLTSVQGRRQRPAGPVGHHLPAHDPGGGRVPDLHRHLPDHRRRRGRRVGHQHRHRRRVTRRSARPWSPPRPTATITAIQSSVDHGGEVGVAQHVLGRGRDDPLQLRRHQLRERHADPSVQVERHDGLPGLSAIILPAHHAGGGRVPDLHRHLPDHRRGCGRRVGHQHRHRPGRPAASARPWSPPRPTATITAIQSPAITVVKSASPSTFSVAGETIITASDVTNSGNVTLTLSAGRRHGPAGPVRYQLPAHARWRPARPRPAPPPT